MSPAGDSGRIRRGFLRRLARPVARLTPGRPRNWATMGVKRRRPVWVSVCGAHYRVCWRSVVTARGPPPAQEGRSGGRDRVGGALG